MKNEDTGLLLNKQDIELHRAYFEEMISLIGIKVLHRAPIKGAKEKNPYGEMDSLYEMPVMTGCIFDEHPNVRTTRKLGWNHERNEDISIIHVPYNLNVEKGSLFIIPSGIDNTVGRVFEVDDMYTGMVYPASITCLLVPYIKTRMPKASTTTSYAQNNFTILRENEEDD